MRVDGKIALVTGAGSGLGRAIAIGLAHSGADVALTELPGREAAARETSSEIEKVGRRALSSRWSTGRSLSSTESISSSTMPASTYRSSRST
jgi:NAD(P)-dependent dehydrogenase (short-subunit alcohol dehydrogenase family)